MKTKPITFAKRFQELLDEAGLNANQLEQLTGIPRQTLGRFLCGENEPGFAKLLLIARALKKSLAAFDSVTVIRTPNMKGNSNE